jgi:Fanconi anemia group J protein
LLLLQVWAGIVPYGADGRQLTATWKESDKLDFQDSLGNSVLSVLGVVPDGVLLFLPSYSLMDKLMTRWKVSCWHHQHVWMGRF